MPVFLTYPVVINKILTDSIHITALDAQQSCARCQTGESCGKVLWFAGWLKGSKDMWLPRGAGLNADWQVGEHAVLRLKQTTLTQLSALVYALPLGAFMLILGLLHAYHEGIQCLIALISAVLFSKIGQSLAHRLLLNALSLAPLPSNAPNIVPVNTPQYALDNPASSAHDCACSTST